MLDTESSYFLGVPAFVGDEVLNSVSGEASTGPAAFAASPRQAPP